MSMHFSMPARARIYSSRTITLDRPDKYVAINKLVLGGLVLNFFRVNF